MNQKFLPLVLGFVALSTVPSFAEDGYSVTPISGASVNFETRLAPIEDQLRMLTGKSEQLDYAVRRLDQAVQRMQGDYEQRLAKMEAEQTALAQAMQTAPAPTVTASAGKASAASAAANEDPVIEPTTASGQLGNLKVKNGTVTGGAVNPKATPLPKTPENYGLAPSEQYDKALSLLREAKYEDAEKSFRTYIEKNPKDKEIENARYWYGETYYVRGKFNEAAVAFADAFQQNPKGVKAPDALLKLGMSLASLNKSEDACTTFASLKKEYPNAPVALRSRADQERARLKCR